jgi:hypothetical protein
MPDGQLPRSRAYQPPSPDGPRRITGALARQYEPGQQAINLAGLRWVLQGLGDVPRGHAVEHPRGGATAPITRELYVGERAWCTGNYEPEWSQDWDRAPEQLSSEGVPCSTFIRLGIAPERTSCE